MISQYHEYSEKHLNWPIYEEGVSVPKKEEHLAFRVLHTLKTTHTLLRNTHEKSSEQKYIYIKSWIESRLVSRSSQLMHMLRLPV